LKKRKQKDIAHLETLYLDKEPLNSDKYIIMLFTALKNYNTNLIVSAAGSTGTTTSVTFTVRNTF